MNKMMKNWASVFVILLVLTMVAMAGGAVTKYVAGTTSAAVTFGPRRGRHIVKNVTANSDLAGSTVKFYAKGSAGKTTPTTDQTNAAVLIYISNASYYLAAGYTTNDHVVYSHANGTMDYATISAATASNITLSAAITVAGASGDRVYEITQQGQVRMGYYGAGAGTNDGVSIEDCFVTPGDSPLYIVADGTAHVVLMATIDKD